MSVVYTISYDGIPGTKWPVGSCHGYTRAMAIAEVARLLEKGAANITLTAHDTSPPIEGAVALHHIRRGCCDGTDPVACYERMTAEAERRAEEDRAARRAARDPKPWDEFDGTD